MEDNSFIDLLRSLLESDFCDLSCGSEDFLLVFAIAILRLCHSLFLPFSTTLLLFRGSGTISGEMILLISYWRTEDLLIANWT